jgi:hypothetical protein
MAESLNDPFTDFRTGARSLCAGMSEARMAQELAAFIFNLACVVEILA